MERQPLTEYFVEEYGDMDGVMRRNIRLYPDDFLEQSEVTATDIAPAASTTVHDKKEQ